LRGSVFERINYGAVYFMSYVALFFAGGFLCNSVPHLVCGVSGMPFPSPFAKPSGIGDSPPLVNFWWGFANLFAGLYLLTRHPVSVELSADFAVFLLGVAALGTFSALHFGKVRREKLPRSSIVS
jgi:hypothetical protein